MGRVGQVGHECSCRTDGGLLPHRRRSPIPSSSVAFLPSALLWSCTPASIITVAKFKPVCRFPESRSVFARLSDPLGSPAAPGLTKQIAVILGG